MERARSLETFLKAPVGRWFPTSPTAIIYCVSPELGGSIAWGRPTRDDIERLLAAFVVYRGAAVAARIDLVLDGRGIEGVDPEALGHLLSWLGAERAALVDRIRLQYGVINDGLIGVLLAGILPTLGQTHLFRVVRDPREALRALSSEGDAICDELESIVAGARDVPRELRDLRDLLRSGSRGATIERTATSLRVSVRSLQRALAESETTFRDEVRDARFEEARALLVGGEEKIATIAHRVGVSENALTQLVRQKTGVTPAELRKQHR